MKLSAEVKVSPKLQAWIAGAIQEDDRVATLLSAAVRESAIVVRNEAARMAPVATGAYRDSIEANFSELGLAATIGSSLPYAPVLEYSPVEHPVIERGEWYNSPLSGRRYKAYRKMNTNPEATWGGLRKALLGEKQNFLDRIMQIARAFANFERPA